MNLKRLFGGLLFVLGGLAMADAPKDDASRADVKAMQGDWVCAAMTRDGMALEDDDAQALFRTVKDDQYTVFRYRKALSKGTFALDATKKPRTIEFVLADGPSAGKPILGIYEWTGDDTYKVCYASPGKDRPADFTCKMGSEHTLAVWRREKK